MKPVENSLFRDNIIHALDNTSNDEELKKELYRLISKEITKDTPFLFKPLDKKTIH